MITKKQLQERVRTGQLIAWMPETDWQGQKVGAILLPLNQQLTTNIYLSYLADKVQTLLDETENPEEMFCEMVSQMKQEGVLHESANPAIRTLTSDLFLSNLDLRERIIYFGITANFPKTIPAHNQESAKVFFATDLEGWLSALRMY